MFFLSYRKESRIPMLGHCVILPNSSRDLILGGAGREAASLARPKGEGKVRIGGLVTWKGNGS